jgi:uracil-DNA glycosylase family 4
MSPAFASLAATVQRCRHCPTMAGRRRVFGPANGSPAAPIVFVGEAPGRVGAERTGVPFSGDQTGRRFDLLLAGAGWSRSKVFLTNAVLCNPQDLAGRNRPPSAAELANCRDHLAAILGLVQPLVVVALGRRALAALHAVRPHPLARGSPPGELHPWTDGRWIGWLLHPSPLTQAHRSFAQQQQDWRRLCRAADRVLSGSW